MLEKYIEKELVKRVKEKGGICFKFNSLSMICPKGRDEP